MCHLTTWFTTHEIMLYIPWVVPTSPNTGHENLYNSVQPTKSAIQHPSNWPLLCCCYWPCAVFAPEWGPFLAKYSVASWILFAITTLRFQECMCHLCTYLGIDKISGPSAHQRCHCTRLVMHQSEDTKRTCADSPREARPLKEIYIWRENCCALRCTNVSEDKSSSDLYRELPDTRLLMEVNKAREATCYWGFRTENGLQLENSITHRIRTKTFLFVSS